MKAEPVTQDQPSERAARPAVTATPPGEDRQVLLGLFTETQRLLQAKLGGDALLPLREILRRCPDHPDALNLASVAFGQIGMLEEAERHSRRAVALRPDDAGFHLNLANRLNDRERFDEAIAAYERALAIAPDHVAALKSYLRCLARLDRWQEASAIIDQLFEHVQDDPLAIAECAEVCIGACDHRRALDLYRQAVERDPDRVQWLLQLTRLAMNLEEVELAATTAERVLQLQEHYEMRALLAAINYRIRKFDVALEHLRAIPDDSDQAANAANLMGMLLISQVKIREGLDVMARTETLAPDTFPLQATRIMYLNYDPDLPKDRLQQAHRAFGARFAKSLPALDQRRIGMPRDPDRRLRIGYVSPDLRGHSVAYFARPYFDSFDRDRYDVVAYAHLPKEDPVTTDLRGLVTEWHNVFGWKEQRLADQIASDRIDILIDLAGLTRDSRLMAFTARPAPVQMTYIGYPNTTGLPQIDYRITDWIADPEGADEDYAETLIRLPGCFLCYAVPAHAPPLQPEPSAHRGYITFGSFNNFAKLNPDVLAMWSDLLQAVPGSRLLCKSSSSNDPTAHGVVRAALQRRGVSPERVQFAEYRATPASHLTLYNDVDIALDSFPYNGTTTTCEALWMGIPVVTLRGDRHAARVGASLLSAVGFEAGIAGSREEYIMTAKLLAEHPGLLKTARRRLRDTVYRSSLCDNQAHARTLEQAFRAVWRIWCEEGPEGARNA